MPRRLKHGERQDDTYERAGVRWRCAWYYWRPDTLTRHAGALDRATR